MTTSSTQEARGGYTINADDLIGAAVLEPGGTLLEVNPAMELLFHRPMSQLVGANILSLLHPDDFKGLDQIRSAFQDGQRCAQAFRRFLLPNGDFIFLEITATLVHGTTEATALHEAGRDHDHIVVANFKQIGVSEDAFLRMQLANVMNEKDELEVRLETLTTACLRFGVSLLVLKDAANEVIEAEAPTSATAKLARAVHGMASTGDDILKGFVAAQKT